MNIKTRFDKTDLKNRINTLAAFIGLIYVAITIGTGAIMMDQRKELMNVVEGMSVEIQNLDVELEDTQVELKKMTIMAQDFEFRLNKKKEENDAIKLENDKLSGEVDELKKQLRTLN